MDLTKDAHSDHISQQFNDELEQVKNHLLEMGGLVERQVGDAIKSLIEADSDLCQGARKRQAHQPNGAGYRRRVHAHYRSPSACCFRPSFSDCHQ